MITKEQIINEYLLGGVTFRSLAKKYGMSRTTINCWVQEYQGIPQVKKGLKKSPNLVSMKDTIPELLPGEITELQKQLTQERLHNKLLAAMIDIAEQELKIPIRKKYGTRQLKK